MGTPQSDNRGGAGGASSSLADRINEHHHAAESHARQALSYARAAGELLLEAKTTVRHGEWLPWLEANFDGGVRTAQDYMRIASRWSMIEAFINTRHAAYLTIREALKIARYGYGYKPNNGIRKGRA